MEKKYSIGTMDATTFLIEKNNYIICLDNFSTGKKKIKQLKNDGFKVAKTNLKRNLDDINILIKDL